MDSKAHLFFFQKKSYVKKKPTHYKRKSNLHILFHHTKAITTMKRLYNIGIVGATGSVGTEIFEVLKKREFPVGDIKAFASKSSLGKTISFLNHSIALQVIQDGCFKGLDFVFFSAGSSISKKYAPIAVSEGAVVIDNSSAFRMENNVPLIIPEINPEALFTHQGIIANPNCSTIIMLMAVAPLHKARKVKRIIVSTYQAASGAGALAMQDLFEETKAFLLNEPFERKVIPHPYAFNLFLHNSPLRDNDYSEEELKMLYETRKILDDPSIQVSATCVRVPVLRAHSESLNIEFQEPISKEEAYDILKKTQGVKVLEDRPNNRFPMPIDASGQDEVFCGRIRQDLSQKNTLELWVVADQILKGAALNAVQIAELLTKTAIDPKVEDKKRSVSAAL